jgi:hypothetical protein
MCILMKSPILKKTKTELPGQYGPYNCSDRKKAKYVITEDEYFKK